LTNELFNARYTEQYNGY